MRALLGGRWRRGILDYHCAADEFRVQVTAWRVLSPVVGLYFIRARSARLLAAYLREIGVRETVRKVASRAQERRRNEKFLSCGFGVVVELPANPAGISLGDRVAFIAPSHPACVERLSLPRQLIVPAGHIQVPERPGCLLHLPAAPGSTAVRWAELAGWSGHSGRPLGTETQAAVEDAMELLAESDWRSATTLTVTPASPVLESVPGRGRRGRRTRKRADLFGYGNYAKTAVLPNVRPFVVVKRIHELDPTQIPLIRAGRVAWDTAPGPREGARSDVWFIAGYHHTHAPLAVAALKRGVAAVIEKPVATTVEQLDALLAAMDSTKAPVYACFQRRYLPFNDMAIRDLDASSGDPISYHCIVYEVPLPERHWYGWPTSGSRLVSNGCHWIDHFLHLNLYADVVSSHIVRGVDGSLDVSLQLANGAAFTMVLTDRGSARVGMQDHVQLRTDTASVRIVNTSQYRAELPSGAVRRARMNKAAAYRFMYRTIAKDIAQAGGGDGARSIAASARATLDLEAQLQRLAATAAEHPPAATSGWSSLRT